MIGPDGQYNIDTYYILLGLDTGLLGFLSYAFIFLYMFYKTGAVAVNRPTSSIYNTVMIPLSCSLAAFFIIKSVLSQEDTHSFVFIILGLAFAALYYERLEHDKV